MIYFSEPVMKSVNEIDFENVDLLELTSSQEHLLYEAVHNVSSEAPNVQNNSAPAVLNTCTTSSDVQSDENTQ